MIQCVMLDCIPTYLHVVCMFTCCYICLHVVVCVFTCYFMFTGTSNAGHARMSKQRGEDIVNYDSKLYHVRGYNYVTHIPSVNNVI